MIHIPVLLHEVLGILDLKPGQFVIDGTLGSGGHARELIKGVASDFAKASPDRPTGTFLGVDRDAQAISNFHEATPGVRVITRQANYSSLPEIISELGLPKADGLLLDLGFSSDQLGRSGLPAGRQGFSFQVDEPLLMTYDDSAVPVRDILGRVTEPELAAILSELGEERYAKKIAVSIREQVRRGKMETSQDLVRAVAAAVPGNYEHGRISPATRTFQALRIYANGELEHLKSILEHLDAVVKEGGRVAIISFHSLEDRIVKNYFKTHNRITKKPIVATEEELAANPRSRSAKLRAITL